MHFLVRGSILDGHGSFFLWKKNRKKCGWPFPCASRGLFGMSRRTFNDTK